MNLLEVLIAITLASMAAIGWYTSYATISRHTALNLDRAVIYWWHQSWKEQAKYTPFTETNQNTWINTLEHQLPLLEADCLTQAHGQPCHLCWSRYGRHCADLS